MANETPSARETSRKWTRIEDYLVRFGRRRSPPPMPQRTEPEEPRFLLSTLPYAVTILILFVIAAGVMILAWPGNRSQPEVRAEVKEQGFASRGWLSDAQREFHPEPTPATNNQANE